MTMNSTKNGAGYCFRIGLGRRNACGDSSAGSGAIQASRQVRVNEAGIANAGYCLNNIRYEYLRC